MAKYVDGAGIPEDKRIRMIAVQVQKGLTVGVLVEKEPGDAKAKRYTEKLRKIIPAVQVEFQGDLDKGGRITLIRFALPKG